MARHTLILLAIFFSLTTITYARSLKRDASTQSRQRALLQAGVPIKLIHFNDNHARFESASGSFGTCTNSSVCYGGFAKQQTAVDDLRAQAATAAVDALLIHAGDQFAGTTWDYVYTSHDNLISPLFLNQLGIDSFTLGNHEFDFGTDVLASFIGNLSAPVIACNVDVSAEPLLAGKVQRFIVKTLPLSGAKVGIIGMTTPDTVSTSSPAPTIRFLEPASVIEGCIADAKAAGAQIIIGATHIGYGPDRELAALPEAQGLDIIIGGHSHTFLYNGDPPILITDPLTPEKSEISGPYPTSVENQKSGKIIPIAQAFWASRYLGVMDVTFNPSGASIAPGGNPILLGDTASSNPVKDNATVADELAELKEPLNELAAQVIGSTEVFLLGDYPEIRNQETNMGDMVPDSMAWFVKNQTKLVENNPGMPLIAIMVSGNYRASIPVGNITQGQVISSLPFGNIMVVKNLTAADLLAALSNGVSLYLNGDNTAGRFLQVSSGLNYSFDPNAGKIIKALLRVGTEYVDLSTYNGTIITAMVDYMATGGDGFSSLLSAPLMLDTSEAADQIFAEYISEFSPMKQQVEGRIVNCGQKPTDVMCAALALPPPPGRKLMAPPPPKRKRRRPPPPRKAPYKSPKPLKSPKANKPHKKPYNPVHVHTH